jgi:hypothetical protein
MSQLNIHLTTSFEKDLNKFMKLRHIKTKSEAIRVALKEGIQHAIAHRKPINFTDWLGLAKKAPVNKKTKFSSDDDLWK